MTFVGPVRDLPPIDRLEGFRPDGHSLYRQVLLVALRCVASAESSRERTYDGAGLTTHGVRVRVWPEKEGRDLTARPPTAHEGYARSHPHADTPRWCDPDRLLSTKSCIIAPF